MTTPPMVMVSSSPTWTRPNWPSGLFALLGAAVTLLLVVDGAVAWRLAWLGIGVASTLSAVTLWARPGPLGAIVALLFAVIGLVAGTGIGLRWLAAGAVAYESIVTTVGLATGVALIVLGLRRLTSGMGPLLGLAIGLPSLLAVAVLVWTLTPAVIATNVPPSTDTTPIDLGEKGREVHFTTSDGVVLWGWYVPPPDGKVAVVRHGSGSTASAVTRHAAALVAHDYGVLMTDARGHGRSGGTAMDFGWYGEADIKAAIDFLAEQPEVDSSRIAIVGMSMGGEEAIGAAGSDDRIAAVVPEGAMARTDTDKTWLIDEYGWRGWIQMRLEWLQYGFTDLLTRAEKPVSLAAAAVSANPTPILMISGGGTPDEGRAAAHLQAASPGNVSVWTVPGAGHTQGLAAASEDWQQTVVDFLDRALQDH